MNVSNLNSNQAQKAINAIVRYNYAKHPAHVKRQVDIWLGLPFLYDVIERDRALRQQVDIVEMLMVTRQPTSAAVNHWVWMYRQAIKDSTPAFDTASGMLTEQGAREYLGVTTLPALMTCRYRDGVRLFDLQSLLAEATKSARR